MPVIDQREDVWNHGALLDAQEHARQHKTRAETCIRRGLPEFGDEIRRKVLGPGRNERQPGRLNGPAESRRAGDPHLVPSSDERSRQRNKRVEVPIRGRRSYQDTHMTPSS